MSSKKYTNDDGTLFIPKRLLPTYNRQTDQMKAELQTMQPEMARWFLEHEYKMRSLFRRSHGVFNQACAEQSDKMADRVYGKTWVPEYLDVSEDDPTSPPGAP